MEEYLENAIKTLEDAAQVLRELHIVLLFHELKEDDKQRALKKAQQMVEGREK